MNKNVLIIAGEPSGDMRAAELLKELKPLCRGTSFWGFGGDLSASQGMELIEHIKNLSIFGVLESIKSLGKIRLQFKKCKQEIMKRRPSAAILIDYPGFNLKMAKFLKKQGIPVIYYIIPQVWAWGAWRTRDLKTYTEKIFVLFEFEKRFLAERNIESEFLGHPLIDSFDKKDLPKKNDTRTGVALLPGSRKSEIEMILPTMLASARIMEQTTDKPLRFVLAVSSNVNNEVYNTLLAAYPDLDINRIKDNTYKALAVSDVALVTSGTATLETAVMLKPFLLVYKSSYFTAILAGLFVRLKYIGLVNLVADKAVVPEKLQLHARPKNIAKEMLRILNEDDYRNKIIKGLKEVKQALGAPGCAQRAAKVIAEMIKA